jgi:hypothetical protein
MFFSLGCTVLYPWFSFINIDFWYRRKKLHIFINIEVMIWLIRILYVCEDTRSPCWPFYWYSSLHTRWGGSGTMVFFTSWNKIQTTLFALLELSPLPPSHASNIVKVSTCHTEKKDQEGGTWGILNGLLGVRWLSHAIPTTSRKEKSSLFFLVLFPIP